MINMLQIESRCARIARTLDVSASDELTLLRTARELKGVHAHLRQAVVEHARAEGWTPAAARADSALLDMQRELKCALVDYLSLPRKQVHDHLVHALKQSFEALDLLESS
jgi:hypothetical protein